MIISNSIMLLIRYGFVISLALLIIGFTINSLLEEKSSYTLLITMLGWMGFLANGVILSTKRMLCPRCENSWIPVKSYEKTKRCN